MQLSDLPPLPTDSGVYLFRKDGVPIYIGKAKNLRNRVAQHFKSEGKSAQFTRLAHSLDFIVTSNEIEALILEANLIKQHRPHYNVLLKDDKHYPFLKLTNEPFPMLIITRRILKDGAHYYGPYPDSSAVRRVKNLIDSMFPLRKNSGLPMQKRARPCLNHHMNRCLAPCVDAADPAQYAAAVSQVRALLEGKSEEVTRQLEADMQAHARAQEFEQAAKLRDRLQATRKLFGTEQKAFLSTEINLDFLGVSVAGEYAMVQLFRMRDGRIVGRDRRFLTGHSESTGELIGAFVRDYYTQVTHVPPLILLPDDFEDATQWSLFLSQKADHKVEMRTPKRGDKKELITLAQKNAEASLQTELTALEKRGNSPALEALQEVLHLPERPYRIEGYDNSNLFGTHIVSGMVVCEGGRMKKSDYRRFRVRGLQNPDDYTSMHQTILRRFTGSLADKLPLPDLLLIDGGIGQVNAALDALKEAGIAIPVIGLAKRFETIILPNRGEELRLPHTHPALRLLIHIRDEVHRYSVSYHRSLRDKGMLSSVFDDLPSVGKKRREILLQHFSSLEEIAAASEEEIAALPSMNKTVAAAVKAHCAQLTLD